MNASCRNPNVELVGLVETVGGILCEGASYTEAVENAPEFDCMLGGNGEFNASHFTA
ncbi:hypothetical protein [Synechococcus sp. CC9311]|uniref:hypothetical protein n=1 Tax=Synechococcus sp. (strain CC9311) TaxID=64471 RepID=UPI001ED8E2FF|nr:hypothetical protein [Synechococcus sp. CC9311]